MENVNPINETPQDGSRLEFRVADQGSSTATAKVPRKRTKTGCLTCRQRRIKCDEEKPICKNCTKSKRECKGYAQRLIFKNPLGVPGVSSTIPAQQPPLPSQYEGQIDFQLTSAGTNGPILAPRLPAYFASEQTFPQSSGSSQTFQDPNHGCVNQFDGQAQTVMEESPTYPPSTFSPGFNHQRQESSNYAQSNYSSHNFQGWDTQNISEAWTTSGSTGMIPLSQGVQVKPTSTYFNPALPSSQPADCDINTVHSQVRSPMTPLSPFEYVAEEDGDYYDVESDEEEPEQAALQDMNQLNMVMAFATRDAGQPRLFTTYLYENMLATYQPSLGSSPLNNPNTARIFLHFIHATGPAISVFERHGTDQSTRLGAPVPMAKQGLWTYTLPLKAFQHQALQQAILAMGSLHIANLQQAPSTASLKHYQYALRRVGKAVGLPTQRKQLGTLAATLLLAYYEVTTADHSKWNNHLAGSAQLMREIDFAGMTRDLRAQRRQQMLAQNNTQGFFEDMFLFNDPTFSDDPFAELESNIDQEMIGCFLGRAINYDQFGQVEGEHTHPRRRKMSRKDIETFRTQCDLYWWFCKQDWLQSLISGGSLFLPFSQWAQCPPRAGLGLKNDLYGTVDHLTLLMGRLADFGVRDRKRKIRAAKATASEWKPDARFGQFMRRFAPRSGSPGQGPPNARSGPPPGQAGLGTQGNPQQTPSSSSNSTTQTPVFYGMVPSSGPRQLPAAFAPTSSPNDPPPHNSRDDDVSYEEAESEWESIYAAFDMFAQSLGPDFSPLPADVSRPIQSPFGLAIQYHTLNMACMMGFYYTGRILLLRLHPAMPPAMYAAAGYAAGVYGAQTGHAGVEGFSPTVGSCLIEITVPIFFAAVQYMATSQRDWIITVLSDISRLTGWKTANAIARGCERAWITAGEQGRGPPYTRREGPAAVPYPPSWKYAMAEANTERRFITRDQLPPTWAMGILSLKDDDYHQD
ncbi:hypothetical protein BDV18DRAFT_136767 [Aspergillus unguis]